MPKDQLLVKPDSCRTPVHSRISQHLQHLVVCLPPHRGTCRGEFQAHLQEAGHAVVVGEDQSCARSCLALLLEIDVFVKAL